MRINKHDWFCCVSSACVLLMG